MPQRTPDRSDGGWGAPLCSDPRRDGGLPVGKSLALGVKPDNFHDVEWTVRHATAETLRALEPLLGEVRSVPGLVEKRPGIFYRKSKAFLHFHEDPSGLHADVRFDAEFERMRVETEAERKVLVERIRAAMSGAV